MRNFTKASKIFGLIIFAAVFYFTGYLIGHKNLAFEKNYRPTIVNRELMKPKSVDFGLFWETWDKVTKNYVGTPDYQKMIYGATSGMVKALGDPYSSFMEPGETKSFLEELSGEISGIGAQIDVKEDQLVVVAPLPDSPAEKAGLKPQDQILKINNEDSANMSLEVAISKIRGKADTEVTLLVMRSGWDQPKEFKITRQVIKIKSVKWEMKGDIAYIEINQFGDDTTELAKQAAKEIAQKNPKAVILDLRSNPGGYLESAVDVTGLFVGKGSIAVKEQYKDGHIEEEKTSADPLLENYKVYILVNGGSASASEILAGALQDIKGSTLIGEKTFGKGSVQNLEDLRGGASLRITIAKWLTPKGRVIDKVGIEPDVKVELSEEDYKAGKDPQLEKALEMANQ